MKFLLDTQAFLWFVLNDSALSQVACDLIIDPCNDILISPVCYWEIAIKVSIGKYSIPGDFETWMNHQIKVNELEILPIKIIHVARIVSLPFHHKDPFDRLLVSQSLAENLPIVSSLVNKRGSGKLPRNKLMEDKKQGSETNALGDRFPA